MFGAKTLNRHAALANRMAETLGLDLTDKFTSGALQAETWRSAVVRCTGCSDPDGCQNWLAEHAETGADAAPAQCRNAQLFDTLARD